ncbi:MAG TPA: DUF2806 domain-containing protein [Pyrinomonadaceae bacterium]|nr:DUF2806 domain-containing protein [Pyrinomonadaceae bacterium]
MEIKDISGLGEPLAKLVEVVASGVGRVSRSFFIKRDADAKAYEIRKLAEALNESTKLLGDATYTKDGLTLTAARQPDILPASPQLEERALVRTSYQEAKKQINIESVVQHAAEELRDKETVSDEKVDEDWITRFFSIAENISSEEMQILWGKILAGEVTRPRSYSLRTLDVLKNFSKEEAEVFAKVAQAALQVKGSTFIFVPDTDHEIAYLTTEFNIEYRDILLLREIGVLASSNLYYKILTASSVIVFGKYGIVIKSVDDQPDLNLPIFAYTTVGAELLPLIDVVPNMNYVHRLASYFKDKVMSIQFGVIEERTGDMFHLSDIEDITPTD